MRSPSPSLAVEARGPPLRTWMMPRPRSCPRSWSAPALSTRSTSSSGRTTSTKEAHRRIYEAAVELERDRKARRQSYKLPPGSGSRAARPGGGRGVLDRGPQRRPLPWAKQRGHAPTGPRSTRSGGCGSSSSPGQRVTAQGATRATGKRRSSSTPPNEAVYDIARTRESTSVQTLRDVDARDLPAHHQGDRSAGPASSACRRASTATIASRAACTTAS